jgi:putative MATE family efflux protein
MRLNTSYKQIFSISLPIMLASAAQNIIVLSDNIFLYHVSSLDFAAIGLVGVFYLIVASIGYGFSRGGQVLMARRFGERNYRGVGRYFQSLILFEIAIAVVLFLFLQFCSPWLFSILIDNEDIYKKCLEYLIPRSYGIFFSYVGISLVSLYTAVANTRFIIIDTVILAVSNVVLNYIFIFGAFGIEPMGIKGAAIASTMAEVLAFIAFVIYMFYDRSNRKFKLLHTSKLPILRIRETFNISMPLVVQAVLGLGGWFVFFTFIENMGQKELEISNLLRTVYLILSIPCWGYSAGINTIVSNFIGNNKRIGVLPIIKKTAYLNLLTTAIITLPVVLFPEIILYPLFGLEDGSLILLSKPLMPLLFLILMVFSVGAIYMNGLIGTGHTITVLWIQAIFTFVYLTYSYLVIYEFNMDLRWAWASELIYWIGITLLTINYLYSNKWYYKKF